MARSVNKVTLIGNIGNDPDIKALPSGSQVANLSIATTDSWRDKNSGEMQERTEWHRVVFFDKLAEICGQYLKKGSRIYIEGNLRTRQWEQDGQKRYTTEIVGREMMMLDGRGDSESSSMGGSTPRPQQLTPQPQSAPKPVSQPMPPANIDDEIPF
ncbi:single-stranded DNA-binding protein [Litorivicinus sp.]|jgi:single-strand DNA-binding protein|nr:single-stranded DNA-binding protein [Litorivicinus sp.]MDC1208391.1 single-stranded DNA-binding protein [Litorivicinus sp.]MDC1240656.1 single-stranded DNA-binding protein [Litorivicinus sp.]|tara:strand:+ start:9784 stop:10251 length:468 start_codon:yes stop_codon:yes gene_type:complete